jgi:Cu/Ag efflux pump CusA
MTFEDARLGQRYREFDRTGGADGQPVAYVEREGESFERRPLKLGTRQGDLVQIVEGLRPGDRVVTRGAYNIRLQAASGAVPVDDVVRALRESNENTSAGFYKEGGQEYLIHGVGRITTLDDIASTVIVERGGQPILVRDVATVQIGSALKRGEGSHNARPAVILGIQKQPAANTLELTRRLDVVMADIQKSLPPGMKINSHIFRQSDFIEIAVHNVVAALRDGAILVLAIVFLLLMSVRATGITVLAIPLSLVTAILAMKLFGVTINTMTLGGMAIAVGALVDDAIIDVENVVRRFCESRRQKAEVISRSSSRQLMPS